MPHLKLESRKHVQPEWTRKKNLAYSDRLYNQTPKRSFCAPCEWNFWIRKVYGILSSALIIWPRGWHFRTKSKSKYRITNCDVRAVSHSWFFLGSERSSSDSPESYPQTVQDWAGVKLNGNIYPKVYHSKLSKEIKIRALIDLQFWLLQTFVKLHWADLDLVRAQCATIDSRSQHKKTHSHL